MPLINDIWIGLVLTFIFFSDLSMAHGGGTDGEGGHYNRRTGKYHFHHGTKAHQHPSGVYALTFGSDHKNSKKNNKNEGSAWPIGKILLAGLVGVGGGYFWRRREKE